MIYQLCDGKRTVGEISLALRKRLNQPISDDVIWLALNDFKRDNLLEESEKFEIDFNGLSRRHVIKKIGFASMIALPLVSFVVAPKAAQAASCQVIGLGCSGANSLGNCCSGLYCDNVNICAPCVPPGGTISCQGSFGNNCTAREFQCCSGSAQEVPAANTTCSPFFGFVAGCVCS